MSTRRSILASAALLLVAATMLVVGARPAQAADAHFRRPVPGAITEGFRPPRSAYGPGHLGIDFAVMPGEPVVAVADGEVSFSGQVGGKLHVVVRHVDGLRTSYSFLASRAVRRGDSVAAGAVVGTAGALFHLGLRNEAGAYLDPEPFFEATTGRPRTRLVPVPSEVGSSDRAGLWATVVRGVGHVSRAVGDTADALAEAVGDVGDAAVDLARSEARRLGQAMADQLVEQLGKLGLDAVAQVIEAVQRVVELADLIVELVRSLDAVDLARRASEAYRAAGERCETPTTAVSYPAFSGRRIAVLVAGIFSSSEPGESGVATLDTAALGYRAEDVVQFSYRGGRVPDATDAVDLSQIASTPYVAIDTFADIRRSGQLLARLLDQVGRVAPGVPIDVFGHSMGGVVARAALVDDWATTSPVEHLMTLASPHQGTNLALVVEVAQQLTVVPELLEAARRLAAAPRLLDGSSAAQLGHGSDLLDDLARRPWPAGLRVLSLGEAIDWVVPGLQTVVRSPADNVLVKIGVPMVSHSKLPSSALATETAALFLAGRPPACRLGRESLLNYVDAALIGWLEGVAVTAVGVAALVADAKVWGALTDSPGGQAVAEGSDQLDSLVPDPEPGDGDGGGSWG